MNTHKRHRSHVTPRRLISYGVLVVVAIASIAGGLFWYNTTVDAKIAEQTQKTQKSQEDAKHLRTSYEAKKAAELKEQQIAAAKKAAEDAKQGGTVSIDPKTCNLATTHINPNSIDVLVNKKHCMQPLGFAPADLVTSNGATLSAKAIDAYNQLYAAASSAGMPFSVTSSYRSYATQISTYNYWVSTSGQAGADTYSARPGYSEHQTGLAFDVAAGSCSLDCFGSTAQYQWLQQHAAEYGFI